MTTQDAADRVVALLADRDPLEVLRATSKLFREIVEQHTLQTLRTRPFDDKWTPLEILGHLVDHEIMAMSRIRLIRFNDEPTLQPYDQERMVTVQKHNDANPEQLAQRFEFLRALNIEQYNDLSPAELGRVGISQRRGPMPLSHLMRIHAGHDLHHLDQINQYIAAIGRAVSTQ